MTAMIVALPSGEAHALPETTAEAGEINRFYPGAIAKEPTSFATFADAARDARIIHIAGHTERQRGPGDVALLFGGGERVSWKTIAARHFDGAPVVVLAACETLRSPHAAGIRTRSLGEGFLAAGAGAVIGTLSPIADRDAGELFRAVHRRLAKGASAEEALRGAQLELLDSSPAWKSVAVLIRRLPDEKEKTWATSRFTSTASARSSRSRSLPSSE
jgi:CHAT domain-containing protein